MGKFLFRTFYVVAIDGFEVVLHGDGSPAVFLSGGFHLVCFGFVAQLAFRIVTEQGEGSSLVFVVRDGVVEHAGITGAVAEGQDRFLADFAVNEDNLVALDIDADELVASYQFVARRVLIEVSPNIFRLLFHAVAVVRANHMIGLDGHDVLDQGADGITLAAGHDIDGEVMLVQLGNHFGHGQIEGFAGLEVGEALNITALHVFVPPPMIKHKQSQF